MEALRAKLHEGPLSFQKAAEYLAKIPNYLKLMTQERLRSKGLRALLVLFPKMFDIDGNFIRLEGTTANSS